LQLPDKPCDQLSNDFFEFGITPAYTPDNTINDILKQLSWWDVVTSQPMDGNTPRWEEFIIIEGELNMIKTRILYSGDVTELPRFPFVPKNTWQENFTQLRDLSVVFQYLNAASTQEKFCNVHNRMLNRYQLYDTNHPRTNNNWHDKYDQWMPLFLAARLTTINAFRNAAFAMMIQQLDIQIAMQGADPQLQQIRISMLAKVGPGGQFSPGLFDLRCWTTVGCSNSPPPGC